MVAGMNECINVTNLFMVTSPSVAVNNNSEIMALVLMAIVTVQSFCHSLLCKNFF